MLPLLSSDEAYTVLGEVTETTLSDEEIWLKAWLATANASNCSRIHTPTKYADRCLEDFKRRFRGE